MIYWHALSIPTAKRRIWGIEKNRIKTRSNLREERLSPLVPCLISGVSMKWTLKRLSWPASVALPLAAHLASLSLDVYCLWLYLAVCFCSWPLQPSGVTLTVLQINLKGLLTGISTWSHTTWLHRTSSEVWVEDTIIPHNSCILHPGKITPPHEWCSSLPPSLTLPASLGPWLQRPLSAWKAKNGEMNHW